MACEYNTVLGWSFSFDSHPYVVEANLYWTADITAWITWLLGANINILPSSGCESGWSHFLWVWIILWSLIEATGKKACMETIRGVAGALMTVICGSGLVSGVWTELKEDIKNVLVFSSSYNTRMTVLRPFGVFVACFNLFFQLPPP